MRKLRAGGIAAALLLGLAAPGMAQQKAAYRQGDGLIGSLFSNHKPDGKPGDQPAPPTETASTETPAKPSPATARAILDREQQILLRRQMACDRLREIALEAGNTEMERQADQLSEQAFAVFQQRTTGLAAIAAEEKDKAVRAASRTLPMTHRSGEDRPAREDQ
jgi:hypothetical protein